MIAAVLVAAIVAPADCGMITSAVGPDDEVAIVMGCAVGVAIVVEIGNVHAWILDGTCCPIGCDMVVET